MQARKTLHSLGELSELIPASEREQLVNEGVTDKTQHNGKGKSVRVWIDRKGRKGKAVTIVSGLQHNPETLEDIARILKQHCGAGGTVKDGAIEVQGDNRSRVSEKLLTMNYSVKQKL